MAGLHTLREQVTSQQTLRTPPTGLVTAREALAAGGGVALSYILNEDLSGASLGSGSGGSRGSVFQATAGLQVESLRMWAVSDFAGAFLSVWNGSDALVESQGIDLLAGQWNEVALTAPHPVAIGEQFSVICHADSTIPHPITSNSSHGTLGLTAEDPVTFVEGRYSGLATVTYPANSIASNWYGIVDFGYTLT